MAYVNFNRTKPASFALSEYADRNTIYFTTDTHEVVVNGQSFGGAVDLTELWKQIDAHTQEIGTLTIELSNLEVTHAEEAEVIAAALNDLNKRLVQGLTSLNDIIIENELKTSVALNDLNTKLVQGLASLNDTIVENELTTSASLNDLNTRLLDTIDTTTIDAMFL